jgi:hypothetical protein
MWSQKNIPKSLEAIAELQAAHKKFYLYFLGGIFLVLLTVLIDLIFDIRPANPGARGGKLAQWWDYPIGLVFFYCIVRCIHIGFTSFVCPNCGATPREESSGYGAGISFNPKRCVRCDYPLSVEEMQKDLTLEKQEAEGRARVLAARVARELPK